MFAAEASKSTGRFISGLDLTPDQSLRSQLDQELSDYRNCRVKSDCVRPVPVPMAATDWDFVKALTLNRKLMQIVDKMSESDVECRNYHLDELDDSDWDYLRRANSAESDLRFLSEWACQNGSPEKLSLTKFMGTVTYRNPERPIVDFFHGVKRIRDGELSIGERYVLARVVSLNGLVFKIAELLGFRGGEFSVNSDDKDDTIQSVRACATHALIFSAPYRNDWAECDAMEMVHDYENSAKYTGMYIDVLSSLLCRFGDTSRNTSNSVRICNVAPLVNREVGLKFCGYNYGLTSMLAVFVMRYWELRAMLDSDRRRFEARPVRKPECKKLISLTEMAADEIFPLRETKFYQSWYAKGKYAALPDPICSLCLNGISNAHVLFIPARDELSMFMLLSPATSKVRDILVKLYGVPEHDALYPESDAVRTMLVPESEEFPFLLGNKFYLAYGGVTDISEFMGCKVAQGSSDHIFHVFYPKLIYNQ